MATAQQIHDAVEAHVRAVGAADAAAVAALYAPHARLHDPAGGAAVVGPAAVAAHFAGVLTEPREMQIVMIAVTGHDAAVHFRATPPGRPARESSTP